MDYKALVSLNKFSRTEVCFLALNELCKVLRQRAGNSYSNVMETALVLRQIPRTTSQQPAAAALIQPLNLPA
jgi:hypothetical protein